MSVDLESARRDWDDGHRRFEAACRDRRQAEGLLAQLEVVSAELRRRVGGTFTLGDLAQAYAGADAWVRHVIEEQAPSPGWTRTVALVEGAAFHVYARGALDYTP